MKEPPVEMMIPWYGLKKLPAHGGEMMKKLPAHGGEMMKTPIVHGFEIMKKHRTQGGKKIGQNSKRLPAQDGRTLDGLRWVLAQAGRTRRTMDGLRWVLAQAGRTRDG